jgi:3-hydroxy-3-methylglutaryl CoA synthase
MTVADLTEIEIQERINEIDAEAAEIRELKRKSKLTVEDYEDVSDNYQMHLEWGYLLSELQEERNFLVQQRNKFH